MRLVVSLGRELLVCIIIIIVFMLVILVVLLVLLLAENRLLGKWERI